MTKAQFIETYARNSGMSVPQLKAHFAEHDIRAEPCDCEDELCVGWQMSTPAMREFEADIAAAEAHP